MKKMATILSAAGAAMALLPTSALAQEGWTSADAGTLESEVRQRYDAALALTTDQSIIDANDTRYLWASEAKVQCGIALGFLDRGNRDETSLSKCNFASDMMNRGPLPMAPQPQQPAPTTAACNREAPGMIFFEFDSSIPGSEAAQVADYVATNAGPCGWQRFVIGGHTDLSGSNAYNIGLSQRRADAVADMMAARGIDRAAISTMAEGEERPRVPTADGVREPQNRRVEIQVNP